MNEGEVMVISNKLNFKEFQFCVKTQGWTVRSKGKSYHAFVAEEDLQCEDGGRFILLHYKVKLS